LKYELTPAIRHVRRKYEHANNATQHFPLLSLRARDLYPSVLMELSDRIVLP